MGSNQPLSLRGYRPKLPRFREIRPSPMLLFHANLEPGANPAFALLEDCLASFRLFCVFMSCDGVDLLPAIRELPCPARLISASRPNTPTTMMMGLSGRHLFKFTHLQRIADMTDLEEAALILACAVLSLARGYY